MSLLNDASLVLIPSGYKEDKVYSIIPSDGSGDLDFVRGSDGTRINSLGQVENVCWNKLQYSEDFANAVWVKYQASVTGNAATAPNGTNSADFLYDNSANDAHLTYQLLPLQKGINTISVFAKANTLSHINLQFYDGSSGYNSNAFDLANGTTTGANQSIESVGNGWYRCSFSYDLPTSANTYCYIFLNNGSSQVYTGTGKGVYVWGYQTNVGALKPYFPTTDRLNVPRLTYENGCPSLLLEKQSTNIATYSEDFSNAVWDKVDTTLSANASISPDGTQTADRFYETATNGSHGFYQQKNISTGTDYTFSCYVKKGNRRYCGLQMYYDVAKGAIAFFDLDNGTLVYEFYEYPGYLVKNSKITSIGNDWYRLEATIRVGISDSYFGLVMASSLWSTGTSYDNPYTGDTSKYIDVWGFQIEQSSYATSYIPTTSTSVTRLADSCYKTGISSLIGQSEGSVFVECIVKGDRGLAANIFSNELNAANAISTMTIVYVNGAINVKTFFGNGGFDGVTISGGSFTIGQRLKIGYRYKSGDFALYINGVQIGTSSTTMTFNGTKAEIRLGEPTTYYGYGEAISVGQCLLFERGLTNTELAQLTTI
jgi:hypothetical protein